MRKISALVFALALCGNLMAQTVGYDGLEEPKLDKKQEILLEIDRLEKIDRADFGKALERMSSEIAAYAETRKKECTGEYSSIEITENGETKKFKNKLSKEEKKLCLLELVKLRRKLAESMFNIRRKLLLQQHQSQLENLEQLKDETLKELEVMAGKLK